ncbi:MAG: phosphomannomutase/phosphoglucomutase [Cellvibrionaceae bacterium]|nr:phosphomannomutase/phosphoglucomutase [Cellvibrionaceae bacterium]
MRLSNIKNWSREQQQTAAILVGLLLMCIALGIWYYQEQVNKQSGKALQTAIESIAATQVNAVSHSLGSLKQDLQRFTEREALMQAIAQQQQGTIRSFMSSLEKTFPQAISIRIIPRGEAKLDRDHPAPIRFTELEKITRAENHQPLTIEANKVDNRWQFNLIAPIPHDQAQQPVATIMVTLPQETFAELLGEANPSTGQFELLQKFDRNPEQSILQVGRGEGAQSVIQHIPNTLWQLRFSPSLATLKVAQLSLLPFISIWVLASALILTGAYQLCRRYLMYERPAAAGPANITAEAFDQSIREYQRQHGSKTLQDILNIEVEEEDHELLDGPMPRKPKPETKPDASAKLKSPAAIAKSSSAVPEEVFRAYDIRGIAEQFLSPEFVQKLGKALGSEALDQGENAMLVGRDCRSHSPEICDNLIKGIISTGCNVIDLGVVPTPLLYYACHVLSASNSGVIVTASHNGPEYNGFKMVFNRNTISDQGIQYIKQRVQEGAFTTGDTAGQVQQQDISTEYINQIFSDIALAGDITVVIDAGNGATSEIAPRLFEELGCKVIPLYCEFDGSFPNHPADPSREKNLQDLIKAVQKNRADVGIAFDGDGDRLGVVTPQGKIIWPDRQLMLFAKDIVSRNPGTDILFDVKCTRQLNSLISSYGGRPIMWKTGHSLMKAKMQETRALLGGELSGHIFFKERWFGFDDGMYSAARLLEIMSLRDQDLDTIFSSFPELPSTPEIKIEVGEEEKFRIVNDLISHGHFEDGRLTTIDGLRVDFAHSWGLVRASNTSPALTLRFEANTEAQLAQIQELFRSELARIAPSVSF